MQRYNRRKGKRYLNWIMKKAGYGKFIIDCRGHPCRVTKVDRGYSPGCDVVSLIDGTTWFCSYEHCGPEPIPEQTARLIKEPILTDEQYDALPNKGRLKWRWNDDDSTGNSPE